MYKVIIAVIICVGVGILSGRVETGEWYRNLAKPSWNPPSWIFAPVWTALYIAMGIAAGLLWKQEGLVAAMLPLSVFAIQLILNAFWTVIFFGWHRIDLALIEIIFLWIAILATMILFYKRNELAGYLIFPYLLWVSFATYLTFTIWRLNR